MKHKRGQIEIMGFALIVILIVFGLLFAVRVFFTAKKIEPALQREAEQLSSSFVYTLLQADSLCTKDTTLQDLLVDCANAAYAGGTITCTDNRRSCVYANETIGLLLSKTLDVWGVADASGYEFMAFVQDEPRVAYHAAGNLSASSYGAVTPYRIKLYPSDRELLVFLCVGGCG